MQHCMHSIHISYVRVILVDGSRTHLIVKLFSPLGQSVILSGFLIPNIVVRFRWGPSSRAQNTGGYEKSTFYLISPTHHYFAWHPESLCGVSWNQPTSTVNGENPGSRPRWSMHTSWTTPQSDNRALLFLDNNGLSWTISAPDKVTAVPIRWNGNFQTPISVPAVRPKRCHRLSNPAHRQDYTVACLNYTLHTMMPLSGWPVMAPNAYNNNNNSHHVRMCLYVCNWPVTAAGSGNTTPYLWLKDLASCRLNSMCFTWSSPTGTSVALTTIPYHFVTIYTVSGKKVPLYFCL